MIQLLLMNDNTTLISKWQNKTWFGMATEIAAQMLELKFEVDVRCWSLKFKFEV